MGIDIPFFRMPMVLSPDCTSAAAGALSATSVDILAYSS